LSRKIKYSVRAIEEQIAILEYIFQKFGSSKANEVFQKISQTLELIAENPQMYPESKRKVGVRKCVFSPQTSIYYRIKNEEIEVITFRPNRLDPTKFKI
jgi:plasmid stabilization system protein ParE